MATTGLDESKQAKEGDLSQVWRRPPTITPYYGRPRKRQLLKTNVTRVLLHDNALEQQFLNSRLVSIGREQVRSAHLFDLTRLAFVQQVNKRRRRMLANAEEQHGSARRPSAAVPPPLLSEHPLIAKKLASHPAATSTAALNSKSPFGGKLEIRRTVTWADYSQQRVSHSDSDDNEDDVDNDDKTDNGNHLPAINGEHRGSNISVNDRKSSVFTTYDYAPRRSYTNVYATDNRPRTNLVNRPKSVLEDLRYVRLSNMLTSVDARCDTSLQLSPSGSKLIKEYGKPLCDLDDFRTVLASLS